MNTARRNLLVGWTAAVLGSLILAVSICFQLQTAPYLAGLLDTASRDSGVVLMSYTSHTSDSWTLRFKRAIGLERHMTLDMAAGQLLRVEGSCQEGKVLLRLEQRAADEDASLEQPALEVDLSGLQAPLDIPLEGFKTGKLQLILLADDAREVQLDLSLVDQ